MYNENNFNQVGNAVTLPLALNDNSAAVAVETPVAQSGTQNEGESCLEPKVGKESIASL